MSFTSRSPGSAARFSGVPGIGSSLSVIVTVAVLVPSVALTASPSVTVKVSSSSSSVSSVTGIEISAEVFPAVIVALPFATAV